MVVLMSACRMRRCCTPRRAHIVNERPIGVSKRVPVYAVQPKFLARWSQVVLLDRVAVNWLFRVRIRK
jgi:hypothetical protein